jgi:thiamine biosynthesis lipoprotein
MNAPSGSPHSHLEPVMGTVVAISSPAPLPEAGVAAAVEALHEADRVFSTWNPHSPLSRLRSGQATLDDIRPGDAALIIEVLDRCRLARRLTGGAFDPWAMPGGVDPTGLVKGWAADRARRALRAAGAASLMVNAGGDVTVAGDPGGRGSVDPWLIAVRHPAQPRDYAAIIEV